MGSKAGEKIVSKLAVQGLVSS